jgi:hypothetical protein
VGETDALVYVMAYLSIGDEEARRLMRELTEYPASGSRA